MKFSELQYGNRDIYNAIVEECNLPADTGALTVSGVKLLLDDLIQHTTNAGHTAEASALSIMNDELTEILELDPDRPWRTP